MKYVLITGCLIVAAFLPQARAQSPAAPVEAKAPAAGQASGFSGKVVETMNAASYTYVQVDTGNKKLWAAAPMFAVKVGDSVAVGGGLPMDHYHSKALNRDFDVVYFTGNVVVNGAKPTAAGNEMELPANHPPIPGASHAAIGHPPIAGASTAADLKVTGIKKADGGKTIAEVFADQARLNGHEVKVRGKVVKYNPEIMNRNWIHIRDGTGAEGSNDLLVTSTTAAKLGDTIMVTGKIATNKDFGANYKYAVMVEDAKVTVE